MLELAYAARRETMNKDIWRTADEMHFLDTRTRGCPPREQIRRLLMYKSTAQKRVNWELVNPDHVIRYADTLLDRALRAHCEQEAVMH